MTATSMIPSSRQRAGFSFIEIMVAMTLLATVIGSLGVLSTRISERARRANLLAQRNYIVVQQLNRYNALPYDSLKLYALAAKSDTIPSALSTIRFLRRDTVSRVTSSPSDTNRIQVTVTIIPLTTSKGDTMLKDSIVLRRRNPRLTSPLNY